MVDLAMWPPAYRKAEIWTESNRVLLGPQEARRGPTLARSDRLNNSASRYDQWLTGVGSCAVHACAGCDGAETPSNARSSSASSFPVRNRPNILRSAKAAQSGCS